MNTPYFIKHDLFRIYASFMLVVSGSSIYVPGCILGQEDMLILNDSLRICLFSRTNKTVFCNFKTLEMFFLGPKACSQMLHMFYI